MLPLRITPAHAGKTWGALPPAARFEDHPRPCGENYTSGFKRLWAEGSPPPMRGKRNAWGIIESVERITPAHAGKTCKSKNKTYSS